MIRTKYTKEKGYKNKSIFSFGSGNTITLCSITSINIYQENVNIESNLNFVEDKNPLDSQKFFFKKETNIYIT